MNAKSILSFLCTALLAVVLVHLARAASITGEWVLLSSDSRDSVRAVITSEVERVSGYATIEESDASNRALLEEKEREDNASKALLADLEKRFKQAKRVRDIAALSFSEKSGEYGDSRKNLQEITTAIQNQENRIALCEKEIGAQQEQLKKYLKTEKQGEALTAVIYTQGIRDTLYSLNRRADELSAPILANLMGSSILSYTEVIGGVLSLDFIRSVTAGTTKPVNEEPVRIQLDVTSKGTQFLRVKRYELYPFQESGGARTTTREIQEKSNVIIVNNFSDLKQFLTRHGYQIAKYDTSRIRKLIDEVALINGQQNEALKETIAAVQERINNQRARISEARSDKERDLLKKARIEETTRRLESELALAKERKERAEADFAVAQAQLNEKKRVSETIILKFALQASKGGQSPADASIEAIIDKLEEVKNEARIQHTRETVEVTDAKLTSYEQVQSSTDARVTAVRLIALTNEGSNGVRVRVAFRVRTVISETEPGKTAKPHETRPAPPQRKQVKKGKKGRKAVPAPVREQAPPPQPTRRETAGTIPPEGTEGGESRDITDTETEQQVETSLSGKTSLTLVRTLTQHTKDILSVAFSSDGSKAASGDRDNNVILWNAHTWTPITTLKAHRNNVQALSFNHRGRYLASGASDDTVIIWDLARKAPRLKIKTDKNVNALAFDPVNSHLATGLNSRDVYIWNAATGAKTNTFRSGNDVLALAYSPNGRFLATAGKEKTVRIWNVTGGGEARELEGHRDDVRALAFSPDGSLLITGGDDEKINVWNMSTGSLYKKLEGHDGKIVALSVSRDGNRLVSVDNRRSSGMIIIWDLRSGNIIKRFETGKKIERCAISRNGSFLLVGSEKELLVYRLD